MLSELVGNVHSGFSVVPETSHSTPYNCIEMSSMLTEVVELTLVRRLFPERDAAAKVGVKVGSIS